MPEPSDPTESPREEALAWFVRLNSGDATDDDRSRFDTWLHAGEANRAAYNRLKVIWSDLDHVPDPRIRRVRPAMLSRRAALAGATGIAASAALIAGTGATFDGLEDILSGDYRTGTGERETITTPDGSTIELDAGTVISLEFDAEIRRLRLLCGRAVFTVAPDTERPFEVTCGGGTVRALGTVFAVHKRRIDTAVAVKESAVTVSLGSPRTTIESAQVAEGLRVTYGTSGMGPVVSAADGAETAWQRGRLIFRDRPLGDVIADLNRYRPGRIAIWDDELLNLRVDGVFEVEKPDAALNAIIGTLPARAVRLTPYLVVLAST